MVLLSTRWLVNVSLVLVKSAAARRQPAVRRLCGIQHRVERWSVSIAATCGPGICTQQGSGKRSLCSDSQDADPSVVPAVFRSSPQQSRGTPRFCYCEVSDEVGRLKAPSPARLAGHNHQACFCRALQLRVAAVLCRFSRTNCHRVGVSSSSQRCAIGMEWGAHGDVH